jgi:hypothetical protein
MERKRINVNQIHSGRIRHKQLDPNWEKIARHTFKVVGHIVQPTFEQWELSFLRDQAPEHELFLWLIISDAFEIAMAERLDLDEKDILGDLIGISTGAPSEHGLKETYLKAGNKYLFNNP